MKKFWLCLILAFCGGTAGAWAVNYNRYGHRVARFGPFTMDGDVTPENAMEFLDGVAPEALGRVELPEGSAHDFGTMKLNDKGEHTYVIKNVGEGELSLRIGESTCKCTIGSLDNATLAPGEETNVKLEWTIKTNESVFSQSAQLLTNDPINYGINLSVTGKVIREIEAVPAAWTFGEVASGEPVEISGTVFCYFDEDIFPTKMKFSDDTINKLAEFDVQPFQPTADADGVHGNAKQGFHVKIKIKPGLRQGSVSQNFMFGFQQVGDTSEIVSIDEDGDDPNFYFSTVTTGRIVGSLSMITGSRITGEEGGGYIYDFGRIGKEDSLVGKALVVLKGSERENTKLTIGRIVPSNAVKATFGEPFGKGSMKIFPLTIEIIPGDKPIARMGKNSGDYGAVWIESDNPIVTKMRVALKFAVDPR